MIRYDLKCRRGHVFDAWFSGSGAFERQREAGQIQCPVCGETEIEKRLMRPAIPARANSGAREAGAAPESSAAPSAPARDGGGALGGDAKLLRQMAREMHAFVRAKAEYVGEAFAKEARKRHETGRSGDKPIWGEASAQEARDLIDEGIEVAPLPPLPDEKN